MENQAVLMPLEATIEEVLCQPEVVKNAIKKNRNQNKALAEVICDRGIETIFVIGSGDSLFSGMSVKQAFNDFAGIPLFFRQAYEYAKFGDIAAEQNSAVIVISSSGRQSTTRDALERSLRSADITVGITDVETDENPFHTKPEHVLLPGAVKKGWPTQTTTSTIAVLLDVAVQIGKTSGSLTEREVSELSHQLDQIPEMMSALLSENQSVMRKIAEQFLYVNGIYFIGSGPGYGVANIGGAVMAEGPQKIGVPLYVEEFHHSLRLNTIQQGTPVFLIAPKDPAYQRYLDTMNAVVEWGGYLIAIVDQEDQEIAAKSNVAIALPSVHYQMSPLLSLMPIHQFSIEITQAMVNKGYQRPCFRG